MGKRTIGILECGLPPVEVVERRGTYGDQFRALIGDDFSYREFAVHQNYFPRDIHDCDGWLITGSKHGVYEDHAWIPPLEAFLRRAYEAEVPLYGVCFGHQIMAQALGGRVEKFQDGWALGRREYDTLSGERLVVNAVHQDQVVVLPPEAEPTMSNDFCRYAGLAYKGRAESIQPHPEFDFDYVAALVEAKPWAFPADQSAQVLDDAARDVHDLSQSAVAQRMREFFSA